MSLDLWPENVALLEILKTQVRGILALAAPYVVGSELGGGDGTLEREIMLDL